MEVMCLCSRCGQMAHSPEACPMVKAVEYFENGTVKRIEYHAIQARGVGFEALGLSPEQLAEAGCRRIPPVEYPPHCKGP